MENQRTRSKSGQLHLHFLLSACTNVVFLIEFEQSELVAQLQRQLSGLREEHSCLLISLKEAHRLIDRHSERSAQAISSEVRAHIVPLLSSAYS